MPIENLNHNVNYSKFKTKIKCLSLDPARAKERIDTPGKESKLEVEGETQRRFDADCNLTGGVPNLKDPKKLLNPIYVEDKETPGTQENLEFKGSGLSLPTGSSPLSTANSTDKEGEEIKISASSPIVGQELSLNARNIPQAIVTQEIQTN